MDLGRNTQDGKGTEADAGGDKTIGAVPGESGGAGKGRL